VSKCVMCGQERMPRYRWAKLTWQCPKCQARVVFGVTYDAEDTTFEDAKRSTVIPERWACRCGHVMVVEHVTWRWYNTDDSWCERGCARGGR